MKSEIASTLPCTEAKDFTPAVQMYKRGWRQDRGDRVNICTSDLLPPKGRHEHGRKQGAVWEAL